MPLFRNIALVLTIYGLLFALAFQCGVPERTLNENSNEKKQQNNEATRSVPEYITRLDELHSIASQMHEVECNQTGSASSTILHPVRTRSRSEQVVTFSWYDWFRAVRFWVCCCIFTTIRLSVTLSALYLSPFLLRTLKLDKSSIMLVPLALYCTSLVTNLLQHHVVRILGRLGNAMIGVIFTLSYCTIVFFYKSGQANQIMVYCAAILLGIGSAFNNVSAIVVITNMIQPNQMHTAAFVHGFASLTDKVFTGLSVQVIQLSLYWIDYRHVEVFIVGGLLLLGGSMSVFDYLYWGRSVEKPQESSDDLEKKRLKDVEFDDCGLELREQQTTS